MQYEIKLDAFEGPLDLLLFLINTNKVDIYNIPISMITSEYAKFIHNEANLDIGITSDYIVMLATLIEIKSRMLLPFNEDFADFLDNSTDPRSGLVEKLIEYRKYKNAADFLFQREEKLGSVYCREQEDLSYMTLSNDENLSLDYVILMNAFSRVLVNLPKKDLVRKEFFKTLNRDLHTVESKLEKIRSILSISDKLIFKSLIIEASKEEIITLFLALLELLKLKEITVMQDRLFDDIYIIKKVEKEDGEKL